MKDIRTFIKETQRVLSPFNTVRTQWEDRHLWTRKWALTRLKICQYLNLGLLSFQILRNKFLLFITYPVYGIFLIAAWTKTAFYCPMIKFQSFDEPFTVSCDFPKCFPNNPNFYKWVKSRCGWTSLSPHIKLGLELDISFSLSGLGSSKTQSLRPW